MKTTNEVIYERALRLLRNHLDGSYGYIGQEPYTGDWFRVFADAYNSGLTRGVDAITGDRLADVLFTRLEGYLGKLTDADVAELVQHVNRYWRDWNYAWEKMHLRNPI